MPANIVPSHPCEDREGASGRLSAHRAMAVVNAWRSRENVAHRAAEASALKALLPGVLARHLVRVRHRPCRGERSEEHTSELQSLMRISYAVFCLKKKTDKKRQHHSHLERAN